MGRFNEELIKAGVLIAAEGLDDPAQGVVVDFSSRDAGRHRRPLRRDEGAVRRLLLARRGLEGGGRRVGQAHAGRSPGPRSRSAGCRASTSSRRTTSGSPRSGPGASGPASSDGRGHRGTAGDRIGPAALGGGFAGGSVGGPVGGFRGGPRVGSRPGWSRGHLRRISRRGRLADRVRPHRRRAGPLHRRLRARRGRRPGGAGRGARHLVARRRPGQPRRLAAGDRAPPRHRRLPPPVGARGALRPARRGTGRGRSALRRGRPAGASRDRRRTCCGTPTGSTTTCWR